MENGVTETQMEFTVINQVVTLRFCDPFTGKVRSGPPTGTRTNKRLLPSPPADPAEWALPG